MLIELSAFCETLYFELLSTRASLLQLLKINIDWFHHPDEYCPHFNGRCSFGQMSSFATSGPVFQSTGFSSPAATLNQQSNLFSTSNSTNQVSLFGQSNVPAMTGNVFENTLSASNQQTGMTSFPLTSQSTTMFSTNLNQSGHFKYWLLWSKNWIKTWSVWFCTFTDSDWGYSEWIPSTERQWIKQLNGRCI